MPVLNVLGKYKKMLKMIDLKLSTSKNENTYNNIKDIDADYDKIAQMDSAE
jgi:hypothetical protein